MSSGRGRKLAVGIRKDRGSMLFLMELVIAVLFFSICAAVCMSMFGKASQLAVKSTAVNEAVVRCSSAAEAYKAAGGSPDALAYLLEEADDAVVDMAEDREKIEMKYDDMTIVLRFNDDKNAEICAEACGELVDRDVFGGSDGEIYSLNVRCAG